jgi:glyoxylase-like metal-dependent hydrolase (beta-lactamase superfamily II)
MQGKKYFSIEPARFRLDGGAMYGIIPKPMWNKVHPSDEDNRIILALRLLLIQTKNKLILIDTGIGDYHGEKFEARFDIKTKKNPLIEALNELNFKADDITDLVISHLHFDHVGGILEEADKKFSPIFKNATLHLHRDHFNYAQTPTKRDEGSFLKKYFMPIISWYEEHNQIHFLEKKAGLIVEDIKFITSMGHTPYLIHPYDDKFIYASDLIPTSNHIHIPWVMAYDIAPTVTVTDKEEFLEFTRLNNLHIVYEHDPEIIHSKVIKNERGDFLPDSKNYVLENINRSILTD